MMIRVVQRAPSVDDYPDTKALQDDEHEQGEDVYGPVMSENPER